MDFKAMKVSSSIKFIFILTSALLIVLVGARVAPALSQDLGDLEEELEQTEQEKQEKEKILADTEAQIASILSSNVSVSQKIELLDDEISQIEKKLEDNKESINKKARSIDKKNKELLDQLDRLKRVSNKLYKGSRATFLELLFSHSKSGDLLRSFVFKRYSFENQVESMKSLSQDLEVLQAERRELDQARSNLKIESDALEESYDEFVAQRNSLQYQLANKNSLHSQLNSEIKILNSQISELQEAILIARSGGLIVPAGSVPTSRDYDATLEGFLSKAPSGYFAAFSFGAYTHRLGMSQYGALARAEAGQSYKTILKEYYGKSPVSKDTEGNIKVEGHGSMSFEDEYLLGIAEMPSHWDLEALKAQAVAARTYAYRYYKDNLTICVTEACQVFLQSKADNPPAAWRQAVEETRGKILENVVTYYSSTSGGYLTTSGWDTTDGKAGATWTEKAWESKAGSPWFYKSWYRIGYSDSSSSCSRKAWMSPDEMTDIINAWLALSDIDTKGSFDESRVVPTTINSCPFGTGGGNPYSISELRAQITNPVTSISGKPIVSYDDAGNTTNVNFQTNRGSINISGSEFKTVFNTRAPGYLSIPQNGYSFFNIEKK